MTDSLEENKKNESVKAESGSFQNSNSATGEAFTDEKSKNKTEFTGGSGVENRIKELETALGRAKAAYTNQSKDISNRIIMWALICLILILVTACTLNHFIGDKPKDEWTWQIIYYTAIRLVSLSALIYVANFSFQSLNKELKLFNQTKNKITIIESMGSFVEAGSSDAMRSAIYDRLIMIVTSGDYDNLTDLSENKMEVNGPVDELKKNILGVIKDSL